MKDILELIQNQKHSYAQLPLFTFMKDRSIDPRKRLAFAPCMAHFIMSFSDLNKYIWRQEDTTDVHQILVNNHTYEDDHHWPWFLTDLQKLEFNRKMSFTESLRFLWSDDIKITRQLSYQLAAYTQQATPLQKIAMIEAIEATGNVLFEHTNQVVSELQIVSAQDYQYFGEFHLQLETGHTCGGLSFEQGIEEIILELSEFEHAIILIQNVFNIFTNWTEELLRFAKSQSNSKSDELDLPESSFKEKEYKPELAFKTYR
ncbi:MAG: hypothetical protein WA902_00860 [Thermosynechococcaceae cyanobacterium]